MEKDRLVKKALYLEYFSIVYNIIEAIVSIIFGTIAGSIALIGFGIDSIIESASAGILIWRFRQHGSLSDEEEEKIERRAMKFVAVTFFILGLYILLEAIQKLWMQEIPEPSLPGIIIAGVSVVVMPFVAWQKNKTGKQLDSGALIADSKETLACSFLSVALLLGLGVNYLFGFWQADPIVAIVIVIYLYWEGWGCWCEAREDTEIDD